MKLKLLATSIMVILLAAGVSFILPNNQSVEKPQPYRFALAR